MDNLINHIERKKSRIILAYDKTNFEDLINLIEMLHTDLIGIKVHSEILNLNQEQNKILYNSCQKHDLFLWEDRKFNDIANTFKNQLKQYENIRDYVSICPISGLDILQVKSKLKYFVLIEMSSRNNLLNSISNELYKLVSKELQNNNKNIAGIICQSELYFKKDLVSLKPGINIRNKKDDSGQVYSTINDLQNKPSLIVVGRGLTNATNPKKEIQLYKY